MTTDLPHRFVARLRLGSGSDERAPGGAITVALCGHWEHEGPCRWPHRTEVESDEDELSLICSFAATPDDLDEVRARIRGALQHGALVGPDGVRSTWTMLEPAS